MLRVPAIVELPVRGHELALLREHQADLGLAAADLGLRLVVEHQRRQLPAHDVGRVRQTRDALLHRDDGDARDAERSVTEGGAAEQERGDLGRKAHHVEGAAAQVAVVAAGAPAAVEDSHLESYLSPHVGRQAR